MSQWRIKHRGRRGVEEIASTSEACRQLTELTQEWERWCLRAVFVFKLQDLTPNFWKSLNDAWREHGNNALSYWCGSGLLTDEWLRKAVQDTLEYWTLKPDSPQAQLKDGYCWFDFHPSSPIPPFAPVFSNPFPHGYPCGRQTAQARFMLPLAQIREETELTEPHDEFYARMDAEYFAYRAAHRALLNAQSRRPVAERDAEFTVCAWHGWTVAKIKAAWFHNSPGDRTTKDPEKTISNGVKSYSEAIGLTIPRCIS